MTRVAREKAKVGAATIGVFLLGAITALVIVAQNPEALGHSGSIEPVALFMQIFAFGASFAMGSLGTALMGKID